MRYEAVIFDMDGVIIDSERFYYEAVKQILDGEGHQITQEYFGNFTGSTHEFTWKSIKEDYQLPDSIQFYIQQMFEGVDKLEKKHGLIFYPGIKSFIQKLHREGYKLAIASSSGIDEINRVVSTLEVEEYFDELVTGEWFKESKPHPEIYLDTARRLGVKPKNCLVIEDAYNGVKSAKDAGMTCIGYVDPKYPAQDLSLADTTVSDFEDIVLDGEE